MPDQGIWAATHALADAAERRSEAWPCRRPSALGWQQSRALHQFNVVETLEIGTQCVEPGLMGPCRGQDDAVGHGQPQRVTELGSGDGESLQRPGC